MPERRCLRVMLVEDDAISRSFLTDALLLGGHGVVPCGDIAVAIAAAAAARFDVVLTDLALPDGGGEALYAMLRNDPASPNHAVPFIALSAELPPGTRARLRGLGFAGALEKPVGIDALEGILQCLHAGVAETGAASRWESAPVFDAGPAADIELPDLDDAAALAVTGSPETLAGLRLLFRAELPAQLDLVAAAIAIDDRERARATLHRLTASCGFCGAAALGEAVMQLGAALAASGVVSAAPIAAFRAAGQRCLDKLA